MQSYNVAPNVSDSLTGLIPIGTVHLWTALAPPTNYLLCNGAAIGRTQFPQLFAVMGTVYGAGDGSTTFNVPNCQARTILGNNNNTMGLTGGSATATLDVVNLPVHGHQVSDPSHTHGTVRQGSGFASSPGGFGNTCDQGGNVTSSTTGITIPASLRNSNGTDLIGSVPFSIVPPFIVLNFIIRAT